MVADADRRFTSRGFYITLGTIVAGSMIRPTSLRVSSRRTVGYNFSSQTMVHRWLILSASRTSAATALAAVRREL